MQQLVVLHDVRLVPVLELEPGRFATRERPLPSGSFREVPQEWDCYWRNALADSGIVGLTALRPGSWHVPTASLTDPALVERVLAAIVRDWGGAESLLDPDGKPVLDGGLALCQADEVLAEPACCVDLGNLSDWRQAAAYRGAGWQMLWIGHPWLSVRYDGRWLVLSGPHESEDPAPRWAVTPEDLERAVGQARAELERFADRLRPAVVALAGDEAAGLVASRLAGLAK
jgi:hypothetical protein